MSLLKDLKLLARLYRDRREFVFRPRWRGGAGHYRIDLRARDGGFEATVSMRRRTTDLHTFRQIFVKRDYDLARLARGPEIERCYAAIAGRGAPLILDLGANIGLASLYFAKHWPKARIIAVEPAAGNYALMCDNVAGHDTIRPVHAAVAADGGAVRIVNPEADTWGYRTEAAAAGADGAIRALSVPELIELAPEGVPFLAKIDIEGFEDNLFSANTGWVAAFPVVVIELHDWMLPGRASSRNFLRTIAPLDRDFVCLGENVFSISNALA
jgi:FkbM family methyltransferase